MSSKIEKMRTTRDIYQSLNFDEGGGVPFQTKNFKGPEHALKKRWDSDPTGADNNIYNDNYESLMNIAKFARLNNIRFVVSEAPHRKALDDDNIMRS